MSSEMQQRTALTKTIELPVPESCDVNPYHKKITELMEKKMVLIKKYSDKEEVLLLTMSLEARLLDVHNAALRSAQHEFETVQGKMNDLQNEIRFFAFLAQYDTECVVYSINKQFEVPYECFDFFAETQPLQLHSFIATYKEKYANIALPLHTEGAIKAAPMVHHLLVHSLLFKYKCSPSFILDEMTDLAEREKALKNVVVAGSSSYQTSSSNR